MRKTGLLKQPPQHNRSSLKRSLVMFILIWVALSLIIFIGMRNYPELPGQKVPKPWMLSLFLLFLVSAGMWAHIFFGLIYHRIRILVGKMLDINSRAGTVDSLSVLAGANPDQWEAHEDTPFVKTILFVVIEWLVAIIGVVIPITILISSGAILTGYLSEQISLQEIRAWFGW